MRLTRRLLVGAVATVLSTSAAMAADPIFMPPPAPGPVVVAPQAMWTGAYFGTFLAITVPTGGPPLWKSLGVVGGYDFQVNRMVLGLNVRTSVPSPIGVGAPLFTGLLDANLNIRAGFLVNDRFLAYGTAGLGIVMPAFPYWTIGLGVEFAMSDRLHLFTELTRARALGGPPVGTAIQFGLTLR